METFEQRQCVICGAIISDNNPDGIGFSCRNVYRRARYRVFMDDQNRRYKYYGIASEVWMKLFIEQFKDTKFRSEFKKNFYPSIVSQYQKKGFISKKQLDIVKKWFVYVDDIDMDLIDDGIKEAERDLIRNHRFTDDENESIVKIANSLRGKE